MGRSPPSHLPPTLEDETHDLPVLLADGRTVRASLTAHSGATWRVILDLEPVAGRTFGGDDLFEALRALRAPLDRAGIRLCCNGARRDTWPSGMSRSMGGARKVYVNRPGRHARKEDLVPTLGEAPSETIGTVEEQAAAFQAWVTSPRT